jgi:dihydrofolate synthase/folylpolyglutamate synthase
LDATNVLQPCLTITTNIDHDHMEILGPTISMIAREKAGIIKHGVPHLVGLLPTRAEQIMRNHCRTVGAPLVSLKSREYAVSNGSGVFDYRGKKLPMAHVSPSLSGEHQIHNCALALRAAEILGEDGFKLGKRAVKEAVESTTWRGRFQRIQARSGATVVVDVCHNRAGVEAFTRTFEQRFPGRRASVIFGTVKRKEHQLIIDSLSRIATEFALVPLKSKRTADLVDLMDNLAWHGVPVKKYGWLRTACNHLLKSSSPDDIICVVGSHYLAGEFLSDKSLL